MDYEVTDVDSIEMNDRDRTVVVKRKNGESKTFTKEEVENVLFKSVPFIDNTDNGRIAYFEHGRCSIDKKDKTLMCGD